MVLAAAASAETGVDINISTSITAAITTPPSSPAPPSSSIVTAQIIPITAINAAYTTNAITAHFMMGCVVQFEPVVVLLI